MILGWICLHYSLASIIFFRAMVSYFKATINWTVKWMSLFRLSYCLIHEGFIHHFLKWIWSFCYLLGYTVSLNLFFVYQHLFVFSYSSNCINFNYDICFWSRFLLSYFHSFFFDLTLHIAERIWMNQLTTMNIVLPLMVLYSRILEFY